MAKSTYLSPMCHDDSLALKHWGNTDTGLNSALDYVRRGWQVIPVHSPCGNGSCSCSAANCQHIAKHPRVRNGLKDASSDPMQVLHWWQTYPDANIGIVTGQQSNLAVLDIDAKNNGFSSLQKLEAQYGPLPLSKRVNTGGGGLHIYFAHPGEPIRNRVNLLPGIDFRGDGGYVVAPPSRHGSGGAYEWQLANEELAPMPSWLLRMLQENMPPSATPTIQPAIAMIPEGTRNNTLVSIGGFLQAKGISGQALENVLATVNSNACHPQLTSAEIADIAKSLGRYKDKTPWPSPEELPEHIATLQSLCANDLPPSLRPWLTDIATRMQIPLEFVAGPALISCATLIGRKVGIRPLQNDDWTVVPNLWGFLVAEPGAMKSPALAAAMKPLDLIEKGERSRFEETCKQMQAAQRSRRCEIEAIRQALKVDMRSDFLDDMQSKQQRLESLEVQDASSKELPEKRYKTNDPTVEKLALILKDNPQGILLLRDELNGWLDSLTRSGREGSKEFYLETWNGLGSFSVDRIGRGSVHVDALCLSIFGGIQPSKLSSYIDRTASASGDDGFLERFQIVFYPERPGEFQLIDRAPDAEAFNAAFEALSYLDRLTGSVAEGSYMRFSANAQAAADRWRVHLETRILKEKLSPIFRSHLSKYRSLMPSLALIFEMLSHTTRKDPPKQVGEVATNLAIRWCQVLESHIRKVYKNSIHDPFFSTRALAQRILSFDVCDGDKVRDIGRKKWKGLTNTESLQTALAELTARSWIRVQRISSQGGPSEVIRINPNLPVGTGKGGSHV